MKPYKLFSVLIVLVLFYNVGLAQCDRCDTLFRQIKEDKYYLSFLAVNESIVNIYAENAKKSPRPEDLRVQDSIYMRDSTKTLEEKYATMNYKGVKVLSDLNRQAMEMLAKLEEMYPTLRDFTDEEYNIFIKMSTEYYDSLKKQ